MKFAISLYSNRLFSFFGEWDRKRKTAAKIPRLSIYSEKNILATGQKETLDAIHVAKTDLNMVLLANLGALVSDIALVKGSADRIVPDGVFCELFACFMEVLNDSTIQLVQSVLVF